MWIIALCSFTGRCSWFNPFEKPDGDDFEEDELDDEEVEPEPNYPQPETGPQLLSSVSNDQSKDIYFQSCSLK